LGRPKATIQGERARRRQPSSSTDGSSACARSGVSAPRERCPQGCCCTEAHTEAASDPEASATECGEVPGFRFAAGLARTRRPLDTGEGDHRDVRWRLRLESRAGAYRLARAAGCASTAGHVAAPGPAPGLLCTATPSLAPPPGLSAARPAERIRTLGQRHLRRWLGVIRNRDRDRRRLSLASCHVHASFSSERMRGDEAHWRLADVSTH